MKQLKTRDLFGEKFYPPNPSELKFSSAEKVTDLWVLNEIYLILFSLHTTVFMRTVVFPGQFMFVNENCNFRKKWEDLRGF